MRINALASRNSDHGQANLFMLVGLTLSLIAALVLFVRLGNANTLRSDAQTAADSAALSAAGVARDNAARSLANGDMPYSRLYDPAEGRATAERYAQRNGATLERIRASDDNQGNLGNIVRVEIQTLDCQRELQQDDTRNWAYTACTEDNTPDRDSNHFGNAAAIAEVKIPDCDYIIGDVDIIGLTCDGQRVESFTHAQQLIDVRLTDSEGQYIYKPQGNELAFAPTPESMRS
ncbi:pilus assembly protein TadG-related protein [Streptomonospora algeriensis]|uniref:Pilus assembly protein TadG-related protein n=1 Tax=Streptomonospora algeriensis TaxID=995084 RepID=A0ABW3BBG7_9ACTN